jgi:uncharacterized protein (DUF924 family)
MAAEADEILDFWFGDALASPEQADLRSALWFGQDDDFDRQIRQRFGALPERAMRAELDAWRGRASSALALVLVVDQFPRNLYRRSARAFAFDPLARDVALESIARGFDEILHPLQASFLYLPLEHAEDIELQQRSVRLFEALAVRAPFALRARFEQFEDYAQRHREVIRRFGRFPHRNALLGRQSSPEEIAYLEAGGDTFG